MICPNCGKEIPDDSTFCNYCGTKMELPQPEPEPEVEPEQTEVMPAVEGELKNKKYKFPIKLLVIVIACVIALLLLIPLVSDSNISQKDKATISKIEANIEALSNKKLDKHDVFRIDDTEELYKGLDDSAKKKVRDISKLKEFRKEINDSEAEAVVKLIDDIGTVDLSKQSKITSARTSYSQLSLDLKKEVTNYSVLKKAEKKLSKLIVVDLIKQIDKIGTVTLNSQARIREAEESYNLLKSSDRQRVTNYDKLEKARATYDALVKQQSDSRSKAILAKLKKSYDKVTDTTWYEPQSAPYYSDSNAFYIYIGERDGVYSLRWKMSYSGDDWIFFDNIIIYTDGETYTKSFSPFDVTRDNDNGVVWEYVDILLDDSERSVVEGVANSKEAIVRFQGDEYNYDKTITAKEKNGIKDVLNAYDLLTSVAQ